MTHDQANEAAEELLGQIEAKTALQFWEKIQAPSVAPEAGDYVTCGAVAGFVLKIQGKTAWVLVRSIYFPKGRERGVPLESLRGAAMLRRK